MERRLAAILAADVVGYSRLMEADEEATARTLGTYREIMDNLVASHRGRVFGSAGDSIIAEFASPVEAVRCAVDIQREIEIQNADLAEDQRMRLRIGVNLGDVMVEGDNLLGDGVNIAARLETLTEPGGISLARSVFDQVRKQLDLGYEYLGEHEVKNITEPVPVYRVLTEPAAAGTIIGETKRATQSWKRVALAAVAVVLIGAAGAITWLRPWQPANEPASVERIAVPLPGKPSIAVLPFANMSGDPAQDYFSDGITADLITDLSRISGLFVIARNTSFEFRGKSAREVRRELGVRFVLGGSVQKTGDRVRINTQLVDTGTGGQLWADRYERELTNVFAVQDELVQRIVAALAVELTADEEEQTSRKRTVDPDAYDMLLRGLEQVRRYTRETNVEAREFFEKAIALDASYARAHANLAFTYAMDVQYGWVDAPDQAIARALEIADDALALDATVRQIHFTLGNILLFDKRHEQSIIACRKALELDPNYADAYGQLALTLIYSGRAEEALEAIHKAMRLDPRSPFVYLRIKGQAHYMMGRYDAAIAEFERVVARNPAASEGHMFLAAAYARVGRIEDAEWEAQETLTLLPELTLARVRQREPYKNASDLDRFIEDLRKAAVPE